MSLVHLVCALVFLVPQASDVGETHSLDPGTVMDFIISSEYMEGFWVSKNTKNDVADGTRLFIHPLINYR
jgi:hypothetical protein